MKRMVCGSAAIMLALTTAVAGERWLHVRVDGDSDEERVRVSVPLRIAEELLASVDPADLHGDRLDIGAELDGLDLRAILAAVRDAPDSEFVTVRSREDSIRVAKEREYLVVHVDEEDGARVRARVPLTVAEAAVRGPRGEIDLAAALRALADHGDIELVHIDSDDGTVRIWVDSSDSGD